MTLTMARCHRCDQVIEWRGAKAEFAPHECKAGPRKMGAKYRRWLVAYATHLAVQHCARRGSADLGAVLEEVVDYGLLDDVDRAGDTWLLEVGKRGPFVSGKRPLVLQDGIVEADFPCPAFGSTPPKTE